MGNHTRYINKSPGNIWPPPAPSDETDAERQLRMEEEMKAREISDAIDRGIASDKKKMGKPNTKILLLGERLIITPPWKIL
jgi:guanine nucleotide-binding protein subunit alpha